jgi:hypothetical protein
MSQLEDDLADLTPSRAIHKLVRDVDRQRAVESGRRADYVSLRPTGQVIACYVHRNRVSIAMDTTDAQLVPARLPGTRLQGKGPTTYVIAQTDVVARDHANVLGLAQLDRLEGVGSCWLDTHASDSRES